MKKIPMIRPAHLLQLCVVTMLGLGVVMVHSAGMSVEQFNRPINNGGVDGLNGLMGVLVNRTTLYAVLAIVGMHVVSRVDVRAMFTTRPHGWLAKWLHPLMWLVLIALGLCGLTLVPGIGRSVNGATRWLALGPEDWAVSFQPSELLKWVMVPALAWWAARREQRMGRLFTGLGPPLGLIALACGMIAIEDLGTAVLIAAVSGCLLLAGGAKWWQLGSFSLAGLVAFAALVVQTPYRMKRLTMFINPWADPSGAGYHPIQSMLAFAQGGLAGVGLGNSVQKYYIPEDTTDFIFPILSEELGLIGAVLVVVLTLAILWLGIGIVRDCKDTFSRLLGLGVLLTFGLQTAFNLAVVTVSVPTKGIALPLISRGGTGWILCAASLGLLAALDNANAMETESSDEPEKATLCLTTASRG